MDATENPAPLPTPSTELDEDSSSPTDYLAALSAKERHRLETRPNIDHLPDAVAKDAAGNLTLLARPGEKIIIERFATVLKNRPWLDTKTYTVYSIDAANGNIELIDDELQRRALSNFITGLKYGYRFKLPTPRMPALGKRKRGRPRKNALAPAPTKAAVAPSDSPPTKRGRGRPKGSKNRPKDLIAAEKKAKIIAKRAKPKAKPKAKPTTR